MSDSGGSVGGFFATLKLKVDAPSFATAESRLKILKDSLESVGATAEKVGKKIDAALGKFPKNVTINIKENITGSKRTSKSSSTPGVEAGFTMRDVDGSDPSKAMARTSRMWSSKFWKETSDSMENELSTMVRRGRRPTPLQLDAPWRYADRGNGDDGNQLVNVRQPRRGGGANFNFSDRGVYLNPDKELYELKKKNLERETTSTKWMLGAALAATAAFVKLSQAIGETWSKNQSLTQTAAKVLVDPLWLKKQQAEAFVAGGNPDIFGAITKLNEMVAGPEMGNFNQQLVTQISGILGAKTDTNLGYQRLKEMSPEARYDTVMKALQKMFSSLDYTTRINAQTIASNLGISDIIAYRANRAYAGGGQTVTETDTEMGYANEASIKSKIAILNVTNAWNLLTDYFAKDMLPFLDGFNKFFAENGEAIRAFGIWAFGGTDALKKEGLYKGSTFSDFHLDKPLLNFNTPNGLPIIPGNMEHYGIPQSKSFIQQAGDVFVSVFVDGKKIPSVANIGIGRNASLDRGMNK